MNVTSSSGWVGEPDYRRGVKWRKLLLEIEVRCRCTSVLASTASTTASGVLGMSERWNVGLLSVPTFRYYWVEHEDRDAAAPCTFDVDADADKRPVSALSVVWASTYPSPLETRRSSSVTLQKKIPKHSHQFCKFDHVLRWANFGITKHSKKKANPHP